MRSPGRPISSSDGGPLGRRQGPRPRTTGYCPSKNWLTNRSSRPLHSMIAIVLLSPSVHSLIAVLPSFSSPLTAMVLLR